jgi:uncharacterized RDD family membrane protein YckC
MIRPAMAVATLGAVRSERAEQARVARLARFVALAIDTFVLSLITLVLNGIFGIPQFPGGFGSQLSWPVLTLVAIVYFTVPEAMWGASPGKFAARLRVVRVDGRPLSFNSIWIRNILKPVDWLPIWCLLGAVSVLLTANSQRVGDRWAGTTVVYRHHIGPGGTRSASPAAVRMLAIMLAIAAVFTAAFAYFDRPALLIQGMYSTNGFPMPGVTSYRLGSPTWGFGTVTYAVDATTNDPSFPRCTGTIVLDWGPFGWEESGSQFDCLPRG